MPQRNGVEMVFHHMGIPTHVPQPGERYSAAFGLYTSDVTECRGLKVQYHRFEPDSCLHPLMQSVPHAAFKVDDLDRAVAGATLILGPYAPLPDYRVAVIDDGGVPIEFIETALSDAEIWASADVNELRLPGDR
mgnify:CR=1 FL=1